jgi:hypothetical protein
MVKNLLEIESASGLDRACRIYSRERANHVLVIFCRKDAFSLDTIQVRELFILVLVHMSITSSIQDSGDSTCYNLRVGRGFLTLERETDVVRAPDRVPSNAHGVCVYFQFSDFGKCDTRNYFQSCLYR